MGKTLKEIYNYEYINNPDTNLLKDINKLLNKTVNELDVHDVCVLIRQEMFLDTSVPKAIELIKANHAAGDYYDYCLLVNLSKMESSLIKYKKELYELITILESDYDKISFDLDSDKEDYLLAIKYIKNKIK